MVVHQALSYGYRVQTVDAIARYHVSSHLKSGGAGVRLHLAVDANGDVFVCQDVETATWSHGQNLIPGRQQRVHGVCALGYTYADGTGRVQRFDTLRQPRSRHRAGLDGLQGALGLVRVVCP